MRKLLPSILLLLYVSQSSAQNLHCRKRSGAHRIAGRVEACIHHSIREA